MPSTATDVTAALDASLATLLGVAMVAKQAHWNLHGPDFRNLHLQLDELADLAYRSADEVAERNATVGGHPDGRPETVAATPGLGGLPAGALRDTDVVASFGEILTSLSERLTVSVAATAGDPVTQDLLTGISGAIEKQAWMLRAHA